MAKILLIETQFFQYNEIIKNKLEKLGNEVDWVDDRPSTGIIDKCILRVKPSLLKRKVNKYFYNKIVPMAKERKYDIVLVVLGQSFNSSMFKDLKKEIPDSKFILYLWDSVENFPFFAELATGFDKVFSFDPYDCKKYGFEFLPLFYNEQNVLTEKIEKQYDVSFIGTVKKGKLPYLKALKKQLSDHFSSVFFYFYLQSKLVFWYNKLFNKDFKGEKVSGFAYKSLPYSENVRISKSSDIIIDATMSKQNGLSMRTIESLAYRKKLITNNPNVVNYDFYKPENIYVFNGEDIDFDNIFFTVEYCDLDEEIYERYSIDHWIETLLS